MLHVKNKKWITFYQEYYDRVNLSGSMDISLSGLGRYAEFV